jgi:hypothetical protein
MIVSIRDSAGKVERKKIDEVWVQAVHSGQKTGEGFEDLDMYRLLLDFNGYYHADEGCCDDAFGCDCDQESRGVVYINGSTMHISYGGECPQKGE